MQIEFDDKEIAIFPNNRGNQGRVDKVIRYAPIPHGEETVCIKINEGNIENWGVHIFLSVAQAQELYYRLGDKLKEKDGT